MSRYRDGEAGLVAQVETKRASARDRAARLRPALRSMLPSGLSARIEALEAQLAGAGTDLTGLTEANAVLDALLADYDAALELAPSLERCAGFSTDPQPTGSSQPLLMEEPPAADLRNALARELTNTLGEPEISRSGDFEYVARFEDAEVPLGLAIRIGPVPPTRSFVSPAYALALSTTMPAKLPMLAVRRKDVMFSLEIALRLEKRIRTGDAMFDDAFGIRGSAATATLLGTTVRGALLALASREVSLDIRDGVAAVAWRGEFGRWDRHDFLTASARDVLFGLRRELVTEVTAAQE